MGKKVQGPLENGHSACLLSMQDFRTLVVKDKELSPMGLFSSTYFSVLIALIGPGTMGMSGTYLVARNQQVLMFMLF